MYQKAEENYRKALEMSPDFDILYAKLGTLYIKMGRNDDAIGLYEQQVKRFPGDDRWEFQLVQSLFAADRREEGLTRLRQLATRNPEEEYVQEYFVQILWELGQGQEAE